MPLSQDTQDLFDKLFGAAKNLEGALANLQLTVEQGATDSRLDQLREQLMKLLDTDGVEKLIKASQEMQDEHARIVAFAQTRPLTDDEYTQLGMLSAGAVILGADAVNQASSWMAMFVYAMKTIWEWLKKAIDWIKNLFHGGQPSQPPPAQPPPATPAPTT